MKQHRQKQRDKLHDLLHAHANQWVPLPRILELGIAQYNARIFELRRLGHKIESRTEHKDGIVHSWFRLVVKIEGQASLFPEEIADPPEVVR